MTTQGSLLYYFPVHSCDKEIEFEYETQRITPDYYQEFKENLS